MHIFDKIADQVRTVGLPLYAVTLTAVPRLDTPLLLMLHWHGFRKQVMPDLPGFRAMLFPVPGSALQLNERWHSVDTVEAAMLDAAWQLGAWDIEREEKRACNYIGASVQEAVECQQAFGEHPMSRGEDHLIEDAPDREALMQLGADVGYIRWQFRPVWGGLWGEVSEDDTLAADGSREPPCPVNVVPLGDRRRTRVNYRLGKVNRIIML